MKFLAAVFILVPQNFFEVLKLLVSSKLRTCFHGENPKEKNVL